MGFFKSMNELQKQSKEINKNCDPGQQMADGMEQMKEANAMMAAQTQAANLCDVRQGRDRVDRRRRRRPARWSTSSPRCRSS